MYAQLAVITIKYCPYAHNANLAIIFQGLHVICVTHLAKLARMDHLAFYVQLENSLMLMGFCALLPCQFANLINSLIHSIYVKPVVINV